jgi:uncharacterized protein (DUF924 family)
MTPGDVLDFWFGQLKPAQWFKADGALDAEIGRRFAATHTELKHGLADSWSVSARGSLAAVIALDQFPRNMFRGTPRAFATDAAALALSRSAIERQFDRSLATIERQFLYMPFQHSEDRATQAQSVALFELLGDARVSDYARRHCAVIERFGRFPHRNDILGRVPTAEEIEFLKQPGSSF